MMSRNWQTVVFFSGNSALPANCLSWRRGAVWSFYVRRIASAAAAKKCAALPQKIPKSVGEYRLIFRTVYSVHNTFPYPKGGFDMKPRKGQKQKAPKRKLQIVKLEERIAPKLAANHNETLVR
jgi:hypothetical protein